MTKTCSTSETFRIPRYLKFLFCAGRPQMPLSLGTSAVNPQVFRPSGRITIVLRLPPCFRLLGRLHKRKTARLTGRKVAATQNRSVLPPPSMCRTFSSTSLRTFFFTHKQKTLSSTTEASSTAPNKLLTRKILPRSPSASRYSP